MTNSVAAFQRSINTILPKEKTQGIYAYLNDIIVCGQDLKDHNEKIIHVLDIATRYNLTVNLDKTNFSTQQINILGNNIHDGIIKADPYLARSLLELPAPDNTSSLRN